jgi:hypothetical protein
MLGYKHMTLATQISMSYCTTYLQLMLVSSEHNDVCCLKRIKMMCNLELEVIFSWRIKKTYVITKASGLESGVGS